MTEYPLPTGTPLLNFHRSTETPFLGSIYLHTLSTLIVVFIPHFVIKPMQMHYAPLRIAATIVFIPDDKRLSGDDKIVNSNFFLAAKRGLTEDTRQVKIVRLCSTVCTSMHGIIS